MARGKKIMHEGGLHITVSEIEHLGIQEWHESFNTANGFALSMRWKTLKPKNIHSMTKGGIKKKKSQANAPKPKYRYTFDSEAHLYAFRRSIYMWACRYSTIPKSREYEEEDWSDDS